MAGSYGDYLENELLDHAFGAATWTPPATVYIALSTADPTDDGSGLAEPSDGYSRKAVDNDKTTWSVASSGALSNAILIAFAEASGAWGTITHFAIFDAASNGNLLGHAELTVSKVVGSGDTIKFAIGELDITLA